MKTIGVIGAGTMGSGIAQLFAQQGMQVVMQDIQESFLERGRQGIEKSLQKLAELSGFSCGDPAGGDSSY
mgnify:CR=1 FL=1